MPFPSFGLKNVPELLAYAQDASEESAPGDSGRSDRAMSSKSATSPDARIAEWAADVGKCCSRGEFAALLDGPQVEGELNRIFRETPEFGRSLAERMVAFLENSSSLNGHLNLIGGGGEAVVLFRDSDQQVIKLSLEGSKARFGWIIDQDPEGVFMLRPGGLAESLQRFALFLECFGSGLEIETVGTNLDFLLMKQPFIVGEHPGKNDLDGWMRDRGWRPWQPTANLTALQELSWCRGEVLVTDVRPENAILAEADGEIYPIDFIVGKDPR